MTRNTLIVGVALGLGTHQPVSAEFIDVPGDFPTIQEAIDSARDGDEIVVAPNTYPGGINMRGKAVTLRSSSGPLATIIDADHNGGCIGCITNESVLTVIRGFTFQNGLVIEGSGSGGAMNVLSNPTYIDCIFRDNTSHDGGGMYNFGANPNLTNCLFVNNTATRGGRGGAMFNSFSNPALRNCTLTENTGSDGAAIYNQMGRSHLFNCIVWDNLGDDFGGPDPIVATYCNVPDSIEGAGNITADPLFIDPAQSDYRLDAGSSCIDAANNAALSDGVPTDLDGSPRYVDDPDTADTGNPDGVNPIVDMGAYEFQLVCAGDFDADGEVGFADLLALLFAWGPCVECPEDINGDGMVEFEDLIQVLASWGPCS